MKKILLVGAIMVSFAFAGAQAGLANDDATAALYKKNCAGCHGATGERATGGTDPIKNLSAAETEKMLFGYKEGSFGGKQKATMERVMKKISDDDTKALSKFVGDMN